MCKRITCSNCGKPSFAGCGRHVESVLGDIPASERCRCKSTDSRRADGPAGGLKRLFGLFVGRREGRRS